MIEHGVIKPPREIDYIRETSMIMGEISHLMGVKMRRNDGSISAMIRGFVGKYQHAIRDGNPAGICVGVVPAKSNTVVVFAHIPRIGAVSWLPALILPSSDRITEIMRVVGRLERFPEQKVKPAATGYYEPKPAPKVIPPKGEIILVMPPRRDP